MRLNVNEYLTSDKSSEGFKNWIQAHVAEKTIQKMALEYTIIQLGTEMNP